jgi:two-component sensor histidine kinase
LCLLFCYKKLSLFALKKLINTVLDFGVESSQSGYQRRKIQTINLLNSIVALYMLISYTKYFILKADFAFIPVSLFLILSLFSLYLGKNKKTRSSFLLFSINVNVSVFYFNMYYPVEAGAYLFYFPLIVTVVLLNNASFKDKFSITHLVIFLLFFVVYLFFDFPGMGLKNLSAYQVKALWYYDLIMSVIVTAILSFVLTRLISDQNNEIVAQNRDLKKAKEAINFSLKEKEILLAELHHRVKNNLAIISGLLNLQEDATSNEETKRILGDSKTRIMSMALVHKMLYENTELKSIDLGKYASELIYELLNSYNLHKSVVVTEDYDKIVLPVNKSIPLGLILNELVTNSIKYTFKPALKSGGVFNISIKLFENNNVTLTVKDNGQGFPQDFNTESETLSLGIYLIKTLSEQIDGKVRFLNENGAKIELNFALH